MLVIKCPYCEEERAELEFRAAGEAHIVDDIGRHVAHFAATEHVLNDLPVRVVGSHLGGH